MELGALMVSPVVNVLVAVERPETELGVWMIVVPELVFVRVDEDILVDEVGVWRRAGR